MDEGIQKEKCAPMMAIYTLSRGSVRNTFAEVLGVVSKAPELILDGLRQL